MIGFSDRIIKLWRLYERKTEAYNFNIRDSDGLGTPKSKEYRDDVLRTPVAHMRSANELRIPKMRQVSETSIEIRLRQQFAKCHNFTINNISLNSDQETFISSDELRINLWNFEHPNNPFTIVDLKPPDLATLSELITCARFHPIHCHQLAYSTSKGTVKLCDQRVNAICDHPVLVFQDPNTYEYMGFFKDIMLNLSDFQFANQSQYILARDYLTLKVWDFRMSDQPCELYEVHDALRYQLCSLYEDDALFDKFTCSWSMDDRYITTGSYSNLIRMVDRHTGEESLFDLTDSEEYVKSDTPITPSNYFLLQPPLLLKAKQFISPEDHLGRCLALKNLCVASLDTLRMLKQEFGETSSEESGLTSESHSQSSDATILQAEGDSASTLTDAVVRTETVEEATPPSECQRMTESAGNERRPSVIVMQLSPTEQNPPSPEASSDSASGLTMLQPRGGRSEVSETPKRSKRKQRLTIRNDPDEDDSSRLLIPLVVQVDNLSETELQSAVISDDQELSREMESDQPAEVHGSVNESDLPDTVSSKKRRETKVKMVSGKFFNGDNQLKDMHLVDLHKRLLRIIWHPKQMRIAAVTDRELYIVRDNATHQRQSTDSCENPQEPSGSHSQETSALGRTLKLKRTIMAGRKRRRFTSEILPSTSRAICRRLSQRIKRSFHCSLGSPRPSF